MNIITAIVAAVALMIPSAASSGHVHGFRHCHTYVCTHINPGGPVLTMPDPGGLAGLR